jgi:hypothetical protein
MIHSTGRRRDRSGRGRALRLASALAVAVALGGCQEAVSWLDGLFAPVGGWVKPGVSNEERRRDEDECQRAATGSEGQPSSVRLVYERCMREKGYELGSR